MNLSESKQPEIELSCTVFEMLHIFRRFHNIISRLFLLYEPKFSYQHVVLAVKINSVRSFQPENKNVDPNPSHNNLNILENFRRCIVLTLEPFDKRVFEKTIL